MKSLRVAKDEVVWPTCPQPGCGLMLKLYIYADYAQWRCYIESHNADPELTEKGDRE